MKYREYDSSLITLTSFKELNLNENFFISLREDYKPGFDKWFFKKQDINDVAFVYRDLSSHLIEAFLYLKIENENENYNGIIDNFLPKRRLKIGTFKITSIGKRMGEKFVQIICDHALLNNIDEIYVTIFENDGDKNKEFLINLLKKFNFKYHSLKHDTKESVFVKRITHDSNLSSWNLYPLINEKRDSYLIPISAKYHSELLPECFISTEDANNFKKNQIIKNSILKVYVGNNLFSYNPKENDIVLFVRLKPPEEMQSAAYRTVITGIGVIIKKSKVESWDKEKLLNLSAISKDELDKKFINGEVLEFLFIDHFINRPILKDLRDLKICEYNEGIRGLLKISAFNFKEILKIANYDINTRGEK